MPLIFLTLILLFIWIWRCFKFHQDAYTTGRHLMLALRRMREKSLRWRHCDAFRGVFCGICGQHRYEVRFARVPECGMYSNEPVAVFVFRIVWATSHVVIRILLHAIRIAAPSTCRHLPRRIKRSMRKRSSTRGIPRPRASARCGAKYSSSTFSFHSN